MIRQFKLDPSYEYISNIWTVWNDKNGPWNDMNKYPSSSVGITTQVYIYSCQLILC